MKKLVQFNELVFNHTAFIDEMPEILTEFKMSQQSYANSHGDYSPERCGPRKVESKQFDVTVYIDKRKFPCEDRNIIEQFVLDNFYTRGRLWAIQGDVLLWGLAKAISISEGYDSGRDLLSFEVTIYMEEGIWHIADPTATYFDDYYRCEVTECYAALERPLCGCCICNIALAPVKFCPPCHGDKLCEIPKDKLATVIGNCGNNKKIGYSCCDQTETAMTYSEYGLSTAMLEFNGQTLYETDDVVLEICGKFKDLTIEWNGQKSKLEGYYEGKTVINSGIVKNGCDYIDIEKFYSVCTNTCESTGDCGDNPMAIGVTSRVGGIVNWTVKKGKNIVVFNNLDKSDIQEIRVYVGGIAL